MRKEKSYCHEDVPWMFARPKEYEIASALKSMFTSLC